MFDCPMLRLLHPVITPDFLSAMPLLLQCAVFPHLTACSHFLHNCHLIRVCLSISQTSLICCFFTFSSSNSLNNVILFRIVSRNTNTDCCTGENPSIIVLISVDFPAPELPTTAYFFQFQTQSLNDEEHSCCRY